MSFITETHICIVSPAGHIFGSAHGDTVVVGKEFRASCVCGWTEKASTEATAHDRAAQHTADVARQEQAAAAASYDERRAARLAAIAANILADGS